MSRWAIVLGGLVSILPLVSSTVCGQNDDPFDASTESTAEVRPTNDDPFGEDSIPSKPAKNEQVSRATLSEVKLPKEKARSNEDRIRSALTDKTSVEFVETPLSDVVEYLKDAHQIEIQFDHRQIDDAGADANTPITIHLNNVAFRSALRLILEECGLAFIIRDEVLLITSPEKAASVLEIKLYDVHDLAGGGGSPIDTAKLNTLDKVIQGTVLPDTWKKSGGLGTIELLALGNEVSALVVSQTAEVHEQIDFVLEEMRRLKKK